MNSIFQLENVYLSAKIAYYNGTPIMSDSEFDSLEKILKNYNSKVINQVGSKTKDYDFSHPTKMLSLSKIQTELYEDGNTNYMFTPFKSWYSKRISVIGQSKLLSSPKFDGNAINLIYIGSKLTTILTRGDGEKGKDVTSTLKSLFPNHIIFEGSNKIEDTIEIRCEVVIDKYLFNDKYLRSETNPDGFSNPRNYVAGVIGKDDYDITKVSELVPVPLHFILNGKHVSPDLFMSNDFVSNERYEVERDVENFVDIIKEYEDMRDSFRYQLDGVVFAFPTENRELLGQNSHDPEWSIAIKFIPEDATTLYFGKEWNVGKTGELTPVILLNPVQLAGTIVKRVSGYNLGFILKNKIGEGSLLTIHKSGDIIPEVQNVVTQSDNLNIPTICPSCGGNLTIDDIHLMCNNESCSGRIGKQLSTNAKFIKLKGLGPKTFDWFSSDFEDLIDLIYWVRTEGFSMDIENYGIKYNSRTHENFIDAFNNIKSLTYGQVIVMLGYNNVGLKLADQIARMYFNIEPDFTSHDKSLISMLSTELVKNKIQEKVVKLMSCGIEVLVPIKKEESVSEDTIFACMTGSPKMFGFVTKEVFTHEFDGRLVDVSLTDKRCQFLITDDYNSTSSKMKTAKKKGIEIFTYNDFLEKMK